MSFFHVRITAEDLFFRLGHLPGNGHEDVNIRSSGQQCFEEEFVKGGGAP